jgi:hypothetical protein
MYYDGAYFNLNYFGPPYWDSEGDTPPNPPPSGGGSGGGGGGGLSAPVRRARQELGIGLESFEEGDDLALAMHLHNLAIGVVTWEA